jgi:hypothetical protein
VNERSRLRQRSKEVGRQKLAQMGLKPLALGIDEAAALYSLSTAQFLKEVEAGNLPPPIGGLRCKRRLWSLLALERAMNDHVDTGRADVHIIDDRLMNEIKNRAARRIA